MVSGTGVTLPYEKEAMHGLNMPDGLEQPDQLMFLCLRQLYGQKRAGLIERNRAVLEKSKLLEEYRVAKFRYGLWEQGAALWKRIEAASSEYRRSPSVEAADKLLEAIYGVERKAMKNGAAKDQG